MESSLINIYDESDEVHPYIQERFTKRNPRTERERGRDRERTDDPRFRAQAVNPLIREYVRDSQVLPPNPPDWLEFGEVPPSMHILSNNDVVPVPVNVIDSPWYDWKIYLRTHYGLLREDAIRPLREAVDRYRARDAYCNEENIGGSVGIYENVHFTSVIFSPKGVGVGIFFSLARVGKRIQWEQSKRLLSGSLVALSPDQDSFRSICVLAIIAARPLKGLEKNPPEIDLFFPRAEELQIDPSQSWVMLEARTGFYEAQRHTLSAIQKIYSEPFPLKEYLVDGEQSVKPPPSVLENPYFDFSSIVSDKVPAAAYTRVNVLQDFPEDANKALGLDSTQLTALQTILSKSLAIVQGPPGTGKTHVSIIALRAMVAKMKPGDPPIIVTCQTNHALDQLLRHLASHEIDFIRLGGRTKDREVIKRRTLYEVQTADPTRPPFGCMKGSSIVKQKTIMKRAADVLSPLAVKELQIPPANEPLDHTVLRNYGIITHEQHRSLEKGDPNWVQHGSEGGQAAPMEIWVGQALEPWQANRTPDDFGFEYEEADLEFEQLKEQEAENVAGEEDELEMLHGERYSLFDMSVVKVGKKVSDEKLEQELRKSDLNMVPRNLRALLYRHFQSQLKLRILRDFRKEAGLYDEASKNRLHGKWEHDLIYLQEQKVIGMTTTGLSKYRAVVAALKPKIVLIEEAAETQEAPVIAACVPSLEQLILVGDHLQLRPHCQNSEYEGDPYYLNVSLFERLVLLEMKYDMLKRQHRMIPEVRRILKPIYGNNITDHPSVKDLEHRPPVPGMGGCNSYFFTHEWEESRDDQMSSVNITEAEMVMGFFQYLVQNGVPVPNITILTFYNGQRKAILNGLRRTTNPLLLNHIFKVVTVDSYQGEENDVVILSLVRSNTTGSIGFLSVDNRVCVAISRAKRGFYLFGNAELLCTESPTWLAIIETMIGKRGSLPKTGPERRLGYWLPITCHNHDHKSFFDMPADWNTVSGGCLRQCHGQLTCGHRCPLRCHTYEHNGVRCQHRCHKTLKCGHQCSTTCSQDCICNSCARALEKSSSRLHLSESEHSSSHEPTKNLIRKRLGKASVVRVVEEYTPGVGTSNDPSAPPMSQPAPSAPSLLETLDREAEEALFGTIIDLEDDNASVYFDASSEGKRSSPGPEKHLLD